MQYLRFCGAFRRYSHNNILLIMGQRPDATHVAGRTMWDSLGRAVRAGEDPIYIFGPPPRGARRQQPDEDLDDRADADSSQPVPRRTYGGPPVLLRVYDIAQTEPIPGAVQHVEIAQRLRGTDPDDIFGRAGAALARRGWSVELDTVEGANAFTTVTGPRRVVVSDRLEPTHAAKSLLHEFGHVVLHAEPVRAAREAGDKIVRHRGIEETEAESVAYVMAHLLGLDTAGYSIGYIARWADGDAELVKGTADRVRVAVASIADSIGLEDPMAKPAPHPELGPLAALLARPTSTDRIVAPGAQTDVAVEAADAFTGHATDAAAL
ncbi:ImmA/IrrE family metallo-endopeptidase [Nocardia asteroides]|uniref:ImmA/IrrE family metallo-endopeptidase n=1 Tax=Nocardia asteroides TaxID=1824 RepID=UPI0037C5DAA0